MADEDEIDVLGDFSIDTLLSKNESGIASCFENSLISHSSELLGCDYALNPPWLLDHAVSTPTDLWYSNSTSDFNAEDCNSGNTSLGFDEVICSENKTAEDAGWTEEEKNLLERGLEIFGKSSVRLSQFIGSKSPLQVKFYLKHSYTANTSFSTSNLYTGENIESLPSKSDLPSVFNMSDIIEDAQIPASIEEVIAAVSTAKPTVHNINKRTSNKKSQVYKYVKNTSFRRSILKNSVYAGPKNKFKKTAHDVAKKPKRKIVSKIPEINETIAAEEPVEKTPVSPLKITPVSMGEQLIIIEKENDEELDLDIEIDIDEIEIKSEEPLCKIEKEIKSEECVKEELINSDDKTNTFFNSEDYFKNVDKEVLKFLSSTEIPTEECILEVDVITDIEKFMHSEFFEGRPTKTPSRYLKIRNHIIDYWAQNKPSYCTKTSVRIGLKNCGDVNCIGRVHQYLEQIGAINFGCCQINYIRPLLNIITAYGAASQPKEKPKKEPNIGPIQNRSDIVRARMKKKYNNDGEGGYTMMHNEYGEVIDTTVVNQDKQSKPRTYRKQNIKLVYCRSFTSDNTAPYLVNLNISALLMIDLHAHSALIEVMGLLGGSYDPVDRVLHITRYVPCRSLDHSNTHCDMCPVSQSEASETLQSEGLEVIGWFHSHPTFYPNPSLQDIDTQLTMQQYLSNECSPFIGVILSPFRSLANSLVSEYRCLIVDKNQVTKDGKGMPYKFLVNITSESFNADEMLRHAQYLLLMESNIPAEYVVDFHKPYFQDNTMNYLEKFLSSIKIHLARCSEINKMTCDAIIKGLTIICLGVSSR